MCADHRQCADHSPHVGTMWAHVGTRAADMPEPDSRSRESSWPDWPCTHSYVVVMRLAGDANGM